MRKSLALFLVLIAFATSGCSGSEQESAQEQLDKNLEIITKKLNDGQIVECVVYHERYAGGISCVPSTVLDDLTNRIWRTEKYSQKTNELIEQLLEDLDKEKNVRN